MKLSKYKRWRALLHRVIANNKQKENRHHPLCLHAVEKYEKMESTNTQNDYETMSK